MPSAEIFAVGSAATIAISSALVGLGLAKKPSQFNALIVFAVAALVAWLSVIVTGQQLPTGAALAFFTLRGILDPGIAALLVFQAFRNLGVSITVPILMGSTLISTLMSAAFFGDKLTIQTALGTFIIIAGVIVLSLKKSGPVKTKYLAMAIGGTIAIGLGAVATKYALNVQALPLSGLAVSLTIAAGVHLLAVILSRKQNELANTIATATPFILSGIVVAAGFIMSFKSFAAGALSIVVPLASTQPLFTLVLSYLFLKQEKITLKTALGTITIVAGAVVLTAFN